MGFELWEELERILAENQNNPGDLYRCAQRVNQDYKGLLEEQSRLRQDHVKTVQRLNKAEQDVQSLTEDLDWLRQSRIILHDKFLTTVTELFDLIDADLNERQLDDVRGKVELVAAYCQKIVRETRYSFDPNNDIPF